jgi:hypothetical protein
LRKAIAFLLLLPFACFAQQPVQVPYSGTAPYSGSTPYSGTVQYNGSTPVTVTVTNLPQGCIAGTPTLSGSAITVPLNCGVVPPPSGCSQPGYTCLKPSGGDDSTAIRTAAAKGPVELAPGSFSVSPTSLFGNPVIYIDDGATVSDRPGYGQYEQMFSGDGLATVKIMGSGSPTAGLLTMPNSYAKNLQNSNPDTNQYNNCIWNRNVAAITITGLRFDKCGGDSIYATGATGGLIRGNVSMNPIRNGFSVTGSSGLLVDSNDFSGSQNCTNAKICNSGDVEPNNPGSAVTGLVITNNKFHDNGGIGLCICLYFTNSSTPIGITVANNTAARNAGSVNGHPPTPGDHGYLADSWPSPMNGAIKGSGNTSNGQPVSFPN